MAAAVKRKGEGIALLSMYADEDEEDADMEDEDEDEAMPDAAPETEPAGIEVVLHQEGRAGDGGAEAVGAGVRREGRGIVDYAHDEAALSPENEGRGHDGKGSAAGIVYHQLDTGNGVLEEEARRSPAAAAPVAAGTGSHVEPLVEVDDAGKDGERPAVAGERDWDVEAAANGKPGGENALVDAEGSLDDFLPPPPTGKCSEELQSKFAKYLALKNSGRSFNEDLRNSKGYRNPDFLQRAVRHQEIDQIGSCFKTEVFDPHGYDAGDFYDAISAEQKKELKRKEQEKKQSQFVRGTVASVPAMLDARPKPIVQLLAGQKSFSGANVAVQSSFRASSSATVVAVNGDVSVKTEGRSKKTKWDRVDEDKSGAPLQMGTKDPLAVATAAAAAASASSARLAATAGSGYPNTWLPKRRETEDKPRSVVKTSSSSRSDRRVDKAGETRRSFE